MPEKVSPEVDARVVRMGAERRQDYPSVTAPREDEEEPAA
jgi:hypothetical protein